MDPDPHHVDADPKDCLYASNIVSTKESEIGTSLDR